MKDLKVLILNLKELIKNLNELIINVKVLIAHFLSLKFDYHILIVERR
jgi:hypothetical protein